MAQKTIIGKEYYEGLKSLSSGQSSSFFKKALVPETANSGKEFIPVDYSAQIILQVYEKEWHRQAIPSFIMSTTKEKIPKFSNMAKGTFLASSITTVDPATQTALTDKSTEAVEIELKTLTMNLMVDNKFLAYNVSPQIENILRDALISEMIETEVDVLINGDDSNTHQDSDVTLASDRRKAFKGLRKLAGKKLDVNNEVFSISTVNKLIELGGRYARGKIDQLLLLVSPTIARQLRDTKQLQTLDKFGPNASILTGEAGKVNGISTIETDYMRSDLNANGVFDNSTKNRTGAILFNPNHCYWGVPAVAERSLSIKVWDDPRFDRKQLILTEDIGFAASDNNCIVYAYNAKMDSQAPSSS